MAYTNGNFSHSLGDMMKPLRKSLSQSLAKPIAVGLISLMLSMAGGASSAWAMGKAPTEA